MSREQDDYDRAVECVLDDLEGILDAVGNSQEPATAIPSQNENTHDRL